MMNDMTCGLRGSRKTFLTYSSALVAAAVTAFSAPHAAAQETAQADDGDVIIVTGTRITRPDYEFANPIVSVGSDTIEHSGATNLTEFVQDLPALVNSFDSYDSADTEIGGAQGLNLLNLRNLGTARTLVLVDGRRHVAGDEGTAAVDINTIPIDLIERVDVLTGGASALYGADGVTGVVNFIMRDDFEGLRVRGQTGWTDEGGGEENFFSIIAGDNFANGRGNFTISFEAAQSAELNSRERSFATPGNRDVLVENPDDFADDPNVPDFVFLKNVRYFDTSPGGSLYTDFDFGDSLSGVDYLGNGSPWIDGIPAGDFTMVGGSGSLLDQFVDQLLPGLDRYTLNTRFHYDLNPHHRVFGEAKWVRTETLFEAQVTYDYFQYVPIDNPFIPTAIYDNATASPDGLANPIDGIGGIFMARDNFDLGPTTHDITRDTYRTVIGLQGDVTENITYEVSAVWGQTQTEQVYHTRNNERWFAATDVVDDGTGNPVCRSDFDGSIPADWGLPDWGLTFTPGAGECVPANFFGENISQQAIDWIMVDMTNNITISQFVLQAYVSGNLDNWFTLPAGSLGFAFGAEYREEESEYDESPLGEVAEAAESVVDWPDYDLVWNGRGVDSFGRFDVAELFAEVNVPILAEMPFAEELSLDAAYRVSEYSTVGHTDTWQAGLRYRPVDWLMFRGTKARAVRAPNIAELFTPTQQTFGEIDDPCDNTNVNSGTAFRYDNCLAAFTALGLADPDPNNFNNTTSTSIPGRASGNRNLTEETADTSTWGVVFEAPFLEGFTISVDYWDIELEDAIQLFTAQTIVDYCYDLPTPNQYCGLVERTPTGIPGLSVPPGGISSFTTQYVNVAQYLASGYDISARYVLDPANFGIAQDVGQFEFALNAAKLDDLTFIESELSPPDETVDDPNIPEWQAVFDLTWTWNDLTVNYGYSWFSETERFDELELAADPDSVDPRYFNYKARSVHDIYAAYAFSEGVRLYGGVNNVANELPERGSLGYPVGPLGRTFFIGANVSFSELGGLLN